VTNTFFTQKIPFLAVLNFILACIETSILFSLSSQSPYYFLGPLLVFININTFFFVIVLAFLFIISTKVWGEQGLKFMLVMTL